MKNCVIYGLFSTRNGDLRYIGQTTQELSRRLSQHKNYAKAKKTAVHKWFLKEVFDGYRIYIWPLVENAVFNETEISIIKEYRDLGYKLLNHTDGGEGTLGWKGNKGIKRPDLAERNRLRKGQKGKPLTPENKLILMAACKARDTAYLSIRNKTNPPWIGKKHSEETKRKMSLAQKGKKLPIEKMEILWAARNAYWQKVRNEKAPV